MSAAQTDLAAVVRDAAAAGLSVATAESLTGGQLAATLVDVPGASGMLQGGVIAYQNAVKERVLGVDAARLATNGAVDATVACQMAQGACRVAGARVGLSTTGVAGPEPHQGKAVGDVFIGVAFDGAVQAYEYHFTGDRAAIRSQAVDEALALLAQVVAAAREQNL
ncbi:CinA family protein [Specibacter cremeus]|uniref:CinA family protein n=1 Tax=Specibacter cremeus TaxID=1629051 RepID=UPI000F7980BE|nr:CinA family protein [Specibacter cremeus]